MRSGAERRAPGVLLLLLLAALALAGGLAVHAARSDPAGGHPTSIARAASVEHLAVPLAVWTAPRDPRTPSQPVPPWVAVVAAFALPTGLVVASARRGDTARVLAALGLDRRRRGPPGERSSGDTA